MLLLGGEKKGKGDTVEPRVTVKEVQRFRDDGRSSWLFNHRATATATTHALPSHPMPAIRQRHRHRHMEGEREGQRSHGDKII